MIDITFFCAMRAIPEAGSGNTLFLTPQAGIYAYCALPQFSASRNGVLALFSPTLQWRMLIWYEGTIRHLAIIAHGVCVNEGDVVDHVRMPSGEPGHVSIDETGYLAVIFQVNALLGESIDVIHCVNCNTGTGTNAFAARLSRLAPECIVIAPDGPVFAYDPPPTILNFHFFAMMTVGKFSMPVEFTRWFEELVKGKVLAECAISERSFRFRRFRYFRNGEEGSSPDSWLEQMERARQPPNPGHFAGSLEYFAAGGAAQFE